MCRAAYVWNRKALFCNLAPSRISCDKRFVTYWPFFVEIGSNFEEILKVFFFNNFFVYKDNWMKHISKDRSRRDESDKKKRSTVAPQTVRPRPENPNFRRKFPPFLTLWRPLAPRPLVPRKKQAQIWNRNRLPHPTVYLTKFVQKKKHFHLLQKMQ